MADPIKLATGQPINLSSPMTTLGGQLGQALGGGLQQLAANRLQRLQQQQQVGGLANLLGGNQELAQNILSQSPDVQKQLLGGLFKPEQALTPYQQSQLDLAQQTLTQKEKIANLAEQKQQRKETEAFYEKYISPSIKEKENALAANRKLADLREQAKKVTTTDRLIEGLPKGILKDYAMLLQSPAAVGAKKNQASFIRGVNDVIKGKLTNYEAQIWLEQFPNVLKTSVQSAEEVIDSLIWINNLAIKKAQFAQEIFESNPNIRIDKFDLEMEKKVRDFLQPTDKKKSDLTNQAAQPETLQPEQPQTQLTPEQPQLAQEQPQRQLELLQEQPQEQLQAASTPQEQAQPQQTIQQKVDRLQNVDDETKFRATELIREGFSPQEALDIIKQQDETTKQTLGKVAVPAIQIAAPLVNAIGDTASIIFDDISQNNFGQAVTAVRKLLPTTEETKNYLRKLGASEEEIENPNLLIKSLGKIVEFAPLLKGIKSAYAAGKLTKAAIQRFAVVFGVSAASGKIGGLTGRIAGEQLGLQERNVQRIEKLGEIGGAYAGAKLASKATTLEDTRNKKSISKDEAAKQIAKDIESQYKETETQRAENIRQLREKIASINEKQAQEALDLLEKPSPTATTETAKPLTKTTEQKRLTKNQLNLANTQIDSKSKQIDINNANKELEFKPRYEKAQQLLDRNVIIGDTEKQNLIQTIENLQKTVTEDVTKKTFNNFLNVLTEDEPLTTGKILEKIKLINNKIIYNKNISDKTEGFELREYYKNLLNKYGGQEYKNAVTPINKDYKEFFSQEKELNDDLKKLNLQQQQIANKIDFLKQEVASEQIPTPAETTKPTLTKDEALVNLYKSQIGKEEAKLNRFEQVHNQLMDLNKKENNDDASNVITFFKDSLRLAGKYSIDVIKPADTGKYQKTIDILVKNDPELFKKYLNQYLEVLINPKAAAFASFVALSKKVEKVLDENSKKDRVEPILF